MLDYSRLKVHAMSEQVAWSDALSVGVDLIDDQHKELIKRLSAFLESLSSGADKGEIIKLMGFLQIYVKRHFEDEEKLQLMNDFPDYASHKQEHEAFKAKLIKLNARVLGDGGGEQVAEEIRRTLLDWLVNHIQVRDKAIATFLAAKAEKD